MSIRIRHRQGTPIFEAVNLRVVAQAAAAPGDAEPAESPEELDEPDFY